MNVRRFFELLNRFLSEAWSSGGHCSENQPAAVAVLLPSSPAMGKTRKDNKDRIVNSPPDPPWGFLPLGRNGPLCISMRIYGSDVRIIDSKNMAESHAWLTCGRLLEAFLPGHQSAWHFHMLVTSQRPSSYNYPLLPRHLYDSPVTFCRA